MGNCRVRLEWLGREGVMKGVRERKGRREGGRELVPVRARERRGK